ncbi:hypothetical protein ACSER5_16390, partial [Pseudomonas aeruginosa]
SGSAWNHCPDARGMGVRVSVESAGAYVAGGDPETDLAIARFPVMRQFLRQGLDESESLAESRARLASLLAGGQA